MGKIHLHIGTHKTGTTTIQRSLSASRVHLREMGICYPDYSVINAPPHYAHLGAANALAGGHDSITQAQAEKFFRDTQRLSAEFDHVIISAEPMWRQVLGGGRPSSMRSPDQYWDARNAYIAHLKDCVGDAQIILVLRNQADFAQSMYQEHVKVTKYTSDFETFTKEFWFHFDYYGQYCAWKAYFPDIKVIRFSDIIGPEITKKFLNRVGLKPGRIRSVGATNVGISVDAVIAKRFANQSSKSKNELNNFIKNLDRAIAEKSPSGRRSFFRNWNHLMDFQNSFSDANDNLALEAGYDRLFDPFILDDDERVYGDLLRPEVADIIINHLDKELAV